MELKIALFELSERWQVSLSLELGGIKIIDKNDIEWLFECPDGSDIFTFYSSLSMLPEREHDHYYWLSLNTNRTLLGSAWVGLYKDDLCLGVSFPTNLLDSFQLENLLENMCVLRTKLSQMG
ncbi:type III secretion system chaperone [Shewanella surugensis]|uniref:Type III secretion system chaperone n=1 Tax=Shewanella surugensis TaxID=212020 RepID=A0ABT0LBA5_9GAMM|nr:type III secretion system chaperone [Shewanella surugensis]MCL1124976.1 type III secretion system chaperone [Shewanella surugensis]